MSAEVLLVRTQNWKLPKLLSAGEWVNKARHIHATEHYSAVNRRHN